MKKIIIFILCVFIFFSCKRKEIYDEYVAGSNEIFNSYNEFEFDERIKPVSKINYEGLYFFIIEDTYKRTEYLITIYNGLASIIKLD